MEKSFSQILSEILERENRKKPVSQEEKPNRSANIGSCIDSLNFTRQNVPGSSENKARYSEYLKFIKSEQVTPELPAQESSKANEAKIPAKAQAIREPHPQEPTIAVSDLGREARLSYEIMIQLGAEELRSGVSESALKRTYRRLAKQFHPDRWVGRERESGFVTAQANFRRLQRAYDMLSGELEDAASTSSAKAAA